MARKQKNSIIYFPHPVTHGKKMSYLEKKYQNDGYATWFKLLEELGSADYHYLDLSDDVQIMFLSDRCLVSEETLMSIINDLIRLKEFDKNLWESSKILFNENFIESISDAYKKRSNECINKKSLLILLDSLGILKLPKSNPNHIKSTLEGDGNTQSKVKYSKVKESRVEKSKVKDNTPLSKIEISDLENDEVEYFEIAKAFNSLFIKNLEENNSPTKHQKNAKFKNYVNPIRLMMEKDEVTKEQLQKVFSFLDSPEGDFWKPNILSTSKLRDKFQQLILKANQKTNEQKNNNKTGGASSEFRRKTAERLGLVQPS